MWMTRHYMWMIHEYMTVCVTHSYECHECVRDKACVPLSAFAHSRAHAHMHTHINIHVHTHTHTHSHAHLQPQQLWLIHVCDMTHSHGRHDNTLLHTATHAYLICVWVVTQTHCNTPQHTATHCNTLQYTATHCNTLRHTATHCNTLQHTYTSFIYEAWLKHTHPFNYGCNCTVCDMSHLRVWHDPFACDNAHVCACHDPNTRTPSTMCATALCVTCLICGCAMTHVCAWHDPNTRTPSTMAATPLQISAACKKALCVCVCVIQGHMHVSYACVTCDIFINKSVTIKVWQ